MNKLHILLVAGGAASLTGCFDEDPTVIEEPGNRAEISRTVDDFDAIEVSGPIRVIVADGAQTALTISGPENILEHVVTNTASGELEIGIDRDYRAGWRWNDDNAVTVTLSHNSLRAAAIAGSGSIDIERSAVSAFDGAIAGSGDLLVRSLKADKAEFTIAGSGDIRVAGAADALDVDIGGSGDFDGMELAATNAEIGIAGSGEVAANVTGTADVSIAGSGDVAITGGAKCTVSKAGSGNVTCQ